MNQCCWQPFCPVVGVALLSTALVTLPPPSAMATSPIDQAAIAQAMAPPATLTCASPALSRLIRHKIAPGETLASIAQQYDLLPTTLMGLNPAVRNGKAPVSTELLIPPYNGIRVELQPKQGWREIAKKYGVRPDVLFEVNGCQPDPKVIFVPGVNWSPLAAETKAGATEPIGQILTSYPLANQVGKPSLLLGYGWGIQPMTGKVGFHSGVDLAAAIATPVLAAGDGIVAFAGNQGAYGKLVVINHPEGLQTRYAQLGTIQVKVGQVVKRGQAIATVGNSGSPSSREAHLHFEVRSRSKLGWVADNPEPLLLKAIAKK